MRWGRAGLLALLLMLKVGSAHAAHWAVSAGASFGDHDWTPAATLDVRGLAHPFATGHLQWQPVGALTAIAGHQASWRADSNRSVWVASAGAALSLRDSGWFLALQGGAADRTTPGLSSHLQFVSSLGWQGRRVRLQLRHISNGRLGSGPNLGESMLLVGIGL